MPPLYRQLLAGAFVLSALGIGAVEAAAPHPVQVPAMGSLKGKVFDLSNDAWNWIDVPTAYCANGTPTGYAINPHAGATKLLIYLEGGGLCTDQDSCWGSSPTAANVNGYNASSFAADGTVYTPFFSRGSRGPFADATQVFVPYCTGDLHLGTGIAELPTPTYFVGGSNLEQYMAQVHAEFPDLQHVWISGSSAGGAGAMFNQYFAVQAFGGVPVDVIDDSAPPVANPYLGVPAQWAPKMPPDCAGCAVDLPTGFYDYDRATYPNSRFAIMVYGVDNVLPFYWGEAENTFTKQEHYVLRQALPDPGSQSFEIHAVGHVTLGSQYYSVQEHMMSWLSQMEDASKPWYSAAAIPQPSN